MYQSILDEFTQKLGCHEEDRFDKYEYRMMLDKLILINSNQPEFDRDVAEQIWQVSAKSQYQKVALKDYINTIIKISQILVDKMKQTDREISNSTNMKTTKQLKININQFYSDSEIIAKTFNMIPPPNTREMSFISKIKKVSKVQREVEVSNEEKVQIEPVSSVEQSLALKIGLFILLINILLELILMFSRNHFFNSLTLVSILLIYVLNFFHKNYLKVCLFLLFGSILFDGIWILIISLIYNDPEADTSKFRQNTLTGSLNVLMIGTYAMIGLKVILLAVLLPFRSVSNTDKKYFELFSNRVDLDGSSINGELGNLLEGWFGPKKQNQKQQINVQDQQQKEELINQNKNQLILQKLVGSHRQSSRGQHNQ